MAYTPTTWATGDTVTATKMNKLEQGVANAGSAVIITDNGTALDKTYAEIYNLVHSGTPCYIFYEYNEPTDLDSDYSYSALLMPIVRAYKYEGVYRIFASVAVPYGNSSNTNAGAPCLYTYTATNSASYPTFFRTSYVNAQYIVFSQGRD